MNLYKISQPEENVSYDTFDSAIVAAESEAEAATIHPNGYGSVPYEREYVSGCWVNDPNQVSVEFIGVAKEGTVAGVILSSYNAG
jgi:hypothetical protein